MAEFIYQMHQVRKAHGDKVILDDVTMGFFPGAKIGVVGPNGMGKSTLLKIMAGKEEISNGEARLAPGYSVRLLEQEPELDDTKTVKENIEMAFGEVIAKVNRFNKIGEEMADPDADYDALMEEMGKLQDEIDAVNGWDLDSQLSQAMDALQCPDADELVDHLSGGERRRVALCKILLEAPDLLLLDEPTNHLDAESVLWLEQFLKNYQGAVLAVTHDRYFLDNVAEWICEVDRGTLYPYKGNYSTYLETKAARMEAESKQNAKRVKKMKSELEWVRSSQKARQAKSKARLAAYEQMEAEALRASGVDYTDIHIPVGPRLGSKVLEVEHLHKAFGDRVLIDDLSFSLPRNGIVGVIGPNGVGKSTLFKMIVGKEQPTSGSLELGETVLLSYVDQNREGLEAEKNVWEVVSGGNDYIIVGKQEIPSRAYVSGAQPPEPGAHAQAGRKPAAAGRADQRPRHRDARVARGGAAGVPRLLGHHLARPLVPGPHLHAHPGVGGHRREPRPVALVRGQLRGLPARPPEEAWARRSAPAPHPPQADAGLAQATVPSSAAASSAPSARTRGQRGKRRLSVPCANVRRTSKRSRVMAARRVTPILDLG